MPAGFVYACDREWLQLAMSASFAGFIEPTLIGPEKRIREAADRMNELLDEALGI